METKCGSKTVALSTAYQKSFLGCLNASHLCLETRGIDNLLWSILLLNGPRSSRLSLQRWLESWDFKVLEIQLEKLKFELLVSWLERDRTNQSALKSERGNAKDFSSVLTGFGKCFSKRRGSSLPATGCKVSPLALIGGLDWLLPTGSSQQKLSSFESDRQKSRPITV